MSKYYKVKIDTGTAPGPYTIYYGSINSSNIATLQSNAQPAIDVTHASLSSNNGVLVIVPDNTTRVILYNQDCDTYEDNLVSYTITPDSSNVNEGESLNLNVETRNVPDGTILYWKVRYSNSDINDFFSAVTGTTTINNRVDTFTVTLKNDFSYVGFESGETFIVDLKTDSIDGTTVASTELITINDTSLTYFYLVKQTYNCQPVGPPYAYYKTQTDYGQDKLVRVVGVSDDIMYLMRNEDNKNDGPIATFVNAECTPGVPTYSITEPTTQPIRTVNEGDIVTFTINTTYVQDGTRLYWTINNNNSSTSNDFSITDGTFLISNGTNTVSTTIVNDGNTDGDKTFYAQLRKDSINGNVLASSGIMTVKDTSKAPPTYSISTPYSVDEGSTANFIVTTTGVDDGTILYWKVVFFDATDSDDFNSISGTTTVNNNTAPIGVGIVSDLKTEGGIETFKIQVRTDSLRGDLKVTSGEVIIIDKSKYPDVELSVTPSCLGTSGSSGRLTFTTVTGGNGGPYYVTLNGIDWTSWSSNYRIDGIADGTYSNVQARDSYGNYSSKTSITFDCYRVPTYSITESTSSINEPGIMTFGVSTQYVPNSTILYWTIEYDNNDFISNDFTSSSGTVTINSVGTGTINLGVSADALTEGTETFRVKLRTSSTSGNVVATSGTVTINDDSKNTQPIWVSRNYVTCYNCVDYTVYQNTNPYSPSSTKDYYRIGESGPIQQGQPSSTPCNYNPIWNKVPGCDGCVRYELWTNTNPCSNATTETHIISLNSGDCYSPGYNCCGPVTTPDYRFQGNYGCDGCAKYEVLVDINTCSNESGQTRQGTTVDGNSTYCYQTGNCCGQPTIAVYNNIILVECNNGVEYKLVEDSNRCSPTYGPDYRIYIPTGAGACYTSYGSFATSCDDAISSTGLVNIYTNGTTYRIGGDNGTLVDGSYYSMLYVDNDGGSDYRYSPRRHVFVNGELNTLDLNGCRLYDNTGQIG